MFFLKKLISSFFTPFGIFFILTAISLFFWFKKSHKSATATAIFAFLWISLLSYYPLSSKLLSPLEQSYAAMETPPVSVRYIHVLGSGHVSNPKFPLSSQLEINSLVRVIEGIRLHKLSKQCKLIFSGSAGRDPISEARINGKMAIAMGVKPSDIILLETPRDTYEEAVADKTITGNETVILVTSASHMPRAKALFEKAGVSVIPAPTDFEVKNRETYWKFPSAEGLNCSEKAFHEYFGLIWGKLSGIL